MEDKKTIDKEKVEKKSKTKKVEEPVKEEIIKEVIVEKKSGFNYAEVIVIMIITLILGGVIGSFITYVSKDSKKCTTKTIINEATGKETKVPSEMNEFLETYNNIINDYYEEVDHKELLEAGINGMLQYLGDDYSVYMNQEVTEAFNEQVEGKYKGIGVEITLQEDESVKITKVFDNSPAKEAGLKVGDVFKAVDGESTEGKDASEISTLIRKSNKDKVTITIERDGEKKDFKLTLKQVDIESVETKVFEKNGKKIGYMELSVFASNTFKQFEKKLLELEGKKIDSLIIDVRDNSGGYLSCVTDIASLFMNKSKIIYQLDTKGVVEQIYSQTKTSRNYDIVVLINGNSASASEILAAALQESYGAKVVGTNSFGKGTVQTAYQLESGATVKYTIQKWLTPNGNWINKEVVTPDIKEELSEDYYKNPSDETDNQLQKAISELSKQK